MSQAASSLDILAERGADPMSGIYLNPGCDDNTIADLQAAARKELGEQVPPSFTRLLKLSNGVQINNALFKKAENVVTENLDVIRSEIIVLGTEGNVAEYVFDKRDRRFHIINMGQPDERFESYNTFEEMLHAVMKEQQVF